MGWMELMLIGVVALIVVGPKDLPVMFQTLGKMTAKVRRMAREFSSAMNDAANATGARDIAKDLKGMTSPSSLGIDKLKDAADKFDKWEPAEALKGGVPQPATATKVREAQSAKIKAKMQEAGQAKLDREKAAGAPSADAGSEAGATAAAKPAAKPKPKKPAAKGTKPAAKSTKSTAKATKPTTAKTAKPAKATKPRAAKAKTGEAAKPK